MNLGDLAKKIWPHLRPNVEQVVTNGAASRGGSGGGGALTAHSLSGTYHTGTLADSQGPQFLMVDGSRTLTGNMLVATGVTIDGVDISEHESATGTSVHGLGTMSTQGANAVAITGGSITGITDLAVADGGTGASNATNARANLGLGTIATQNANAVSITGGSITGITDLTVADGGTGASTAADARTNLGLGTIATQNANAVLITGGSITGITDLAIADGGTGASTAAGAASNLGVGVEDSPTFTGLTLSGLSASRLVATNGSDALTSVSALSSWVAGTANRVTVSDDGDGSITLTTPQDIHTGALPTFAGLTVNGNIAVTGTVDGIDISNFAASSFLVLAATSAITNERVLTAGAGMTGSDAGIGGAYTLNVVGDSTINVGADSIGVNTAYGFTWTGAHEFREDLQVYNPAELTTPVLYVDQSAYAVGINRDPDIQFSLDIAGALRADYLVGKHAIQLSDALLIAHYDGPGPYESDYTGTPQGHKGQIGTEVGGIVYREGKFGKAVQVGTGTTNLITNPSFETNTTGWINQDVTTSRVSTYSYYGDYSLSIVGTGVNRRTLYILSVTAGTTYTASAWAYAPTGATMFIGVLSNTATVTFATSSNATANIWSRVSLTFTPSTSGTVYIALYNTSTTVTGYFDAVQVEAKSYATPYHDGSLTTPETWDGAEHASASTRLAATLTYPIDNIDPASGTIMMWIYLHNANPGGGILWAAGNVNGEFDAYINASGVLVFRENTNANATYNIASLYKTWIHVAMTWDVAANNHALYVNGVQRYSGAYSAATLGTALGIGYSPPIGTQYNHPGLIDDLVILSRSAPADEIRSIYESDAPVFAESSTSFFKNYGPTPVEINEEGLFVRSVTTGAVLGVYGGGGTKSWGGLTLGDADILIGRDPDGYIHWDDSEPALRISLAGETISLDENGITIEPGEGFFVGIANAFKFGGGTTGRTASGHIEASVNAANDNAYVDVYAGNQWGAFNLAETDFDTARLVLATRSKSSVDSNIVVFSSSDETTSGLHDFPSVNNAISMYSENVHLYGNIRGISASLVDFANTSGSLSSSNGFFTVNNGLLGFTLWSYSGLAGTAQSVIPDGTNDVSSGATITYWVRPSSGSPGGGMITCANNQSNYLWNNGSDLVTLDISSTGILTVQRTSGSLTYDVSLMILWQ